MQKGTRFIAIWFLVFSIIRRVKVKHFCKLCCLFATLAFSGWVFAEPVTESNSDSRVNISDGSYSRVDTDTFSLVDENDDHFTQIESSVTTTTVISGNGEQFDETFPAVPTMDGFGNPTTDGGINDISYTIPSDYSSWFQQKRREVYMDFLMTVVNTKYPDYTGCERSSLNCGTVLIEPDNDSVIGQFPSGNRVGICGNQLYFTDGEGNLINEPVTTLNTWFPNINEFLNKPSFSNWGTTFTPPSGSTTFPQIHSFGISDFIKPTLGWDGLQNECDPEKLKEGAKEESPVEDEKLESCENGSDCEQKEIMPSLDGETTFCSDHSDSDCLQEGWAELEFVGYEESYKIGNTLKIELVENLQVSNRFNKVDLWVAIEDPKGNVWFMTDRLFQPFIKAVSITFKGARSFKQSLESSTKKHSLLEIDILEGMEGVYKFYAVYTTEGTNINTLFINQRSNLATATITVEEQAENQ